MSNTIFIIIAVVCILLSAFFSMSEIAFSSADKFKLKSNYDKNPKKYGITFKISESFDDTISTILVGNNLVNIAISSAATLFCIQKINPDIGPVVATIATTVVVLIFGEILPKLIGSAFANSLIYILSVPLKIFEIIFKFITWPVNKLINKVSKNDEVEQAPSLTDDELIDIVDQIEDSGEIDEEKSDLIKHAINFKDTTAYEVMIHRVNVVALDIKDGIEEFTKNPDLLKYSYVPVYEDTIDNIIGIVSTRQVLKLLIKEIDIDIRDILKEPMYVNETKRIDDIFKEMHQTRTKIVVVVDEFGGTDGILTKEDILEELVGEIFDEKDKIEYDYTELNDNEFIVDGDMNIYDMFELVEVDSSNFESEYSTVSGWCSEVLDDIPEKGQSFEYKNLTIKILKCDETTVEKVKIIKKEEINTEVDIDL